MTASSSSQHSSQDSVNPTVRRQADAIRQRTDRRAKGRDRRSGSPDRRSSDSAETTPRNVMEVLIEGELDRQLKRLSEQQRANLKIPQVTAYALNRLPSLYVTSSKGWRQQWVHGQSALQKDIETAVRRAIVAVQRDPLRAMSPVGHCLPDVAEAPMAQLRLLLQDDKLGWETLVPTIQRLLVEGKMHFPDEVNAKAKKARSASSHDGDSSAGDSYGQNNGKFDWDSHPLHQRGY